MLLVIAASLAVFILSTPDKPERVELEPLSNENPRAISRVRLELAAAGAIELLRSEGSWQLLEPIRIAANEFRIKTLLRVLEAPVHLRIDVASQQLARFGLASPKARMLLDGKEILFGDTEPIHGRRYLLFNGQVALVDDNYFSHLSSSAANFVDPALLGPDASIQSIDLPTMRIYRDSGDWRLDSGDLGANADEIAQLVDNWRSAQATAVRPYEPSLDWDGGILVALADGSVAFDLARTQYEVILGRADLGIQYHLTKTTGTRLLNLSSSRE